MARGRNEAESHERFEKSKDITKRQIESLKTKKRLFFAAVELFREHGYNNVRVSDITERANVTKGAFYFHFKSKESIVLEAIRQSDLTYQEWYGSADKETDANEQLLQLAEVVNIYARSVGLEFTKVVYMNQIALGPKTVHLLNNEDRPFFAIIMDIIGRGQERGELRRDLPAVALTRIYMRWIRSVIYDWCLYDGAHDIVEDGRRFFSFMLQTFRAGPRSAV